jgi:4-amino-4-deoxychorismate lyase
MRISAVYRSPGRWTSWQHVHGCPCRRIPTHHATVECRSQHTRDVLPENHTSLVPTRRLAAQEAQEAWQRRNAMGMESNRVESLYSSEIGGIVTDGRMMGMNIDESLVLHGHGVYEHLMVVDGHVYQLEDRIDRLIAMSDRANIRLPNKWHKEQMKRIVLETIAAGKCLEGIVTVVVSLGRSRGVSYDMASHQSKKMEANLYVLFSREDSKKSESEEYLKGWKVKTSPIPCKPGYFARLKSTDRFQDTMVVLDAQAEGSQTGIYVDSQGYVAGSPEANVAFLQQDGSLVIPETDYAVTTLTLSRLLELVDQYQSDVQISKIEIRPISVEEAKNSVEMMLIGSQYPVMPVVAWDGASIGDGTVGVVSLQLRTLLQSDVYPEGDGSILHTEVPYGYLTGM